LRRSTSISRCPAARTSISVSWDYQRSRRKNQHPHEAVETEALSQRLIIELLESKVTALLPEPLERVHEREELERQAQREKI
jgi:hypothetical protein